MTWNCLTTVTENCKAEKVHPKDLDDFVNFQVQHGFEPSTINRGLAAAVSFYRFLIREGKATTCPVLAKRHYLREPQRLPCPVNEQELRKFFGAIEDARDRTMFTLMLRCGLRIGEVSALQMTDLYLGEMPSRLTIRGKGARERTIYLSPVTEAHLHGWPAQRPKDYDQHVFLSYQRRKLSTASIAVRINHICKLSGVNLTAHRLRYTFGRSFGRLVMHRRTQSVSRNRFSHPGDMEYQDVLCWSASRGKERVVRGRPRPKK